MAEPLTPAATTTAAEVEALPATVVDPAARIFDPQQIVAVLDDTRLAAVKEAVAREAFKRAADELERILGEKPPEASERQAWTFQLGLLRRRSGHPLAAVRAFDRVATSDSVLRGYARWMAADLLEQVGEPAEAKVRLDGIEAGTAIDDRIRLVRARALASMGQVDAAAPIWRAELGRKPRPAGWQLIALRFAKALLEQPSVAHAEEAVAVARLVIYESPRGRGVGEARELEQRALLTIPFERRERLDKPELGEATAQARALGEAKQGREAIAAAERIIDQLEDESPSEPACEAYIAKGRGLDVLRRRAEASEAFGTAVERCEGHPRQVVALFLGGRAALRGGQAAKARRRYALLEERFSEHSFADDARLYGAQAALRLGDEAAFTAMLGRIADDYPEGDMVDEALFALARAQIDEHDWAAAVAPLERAIARSYRGRPYYAEGRPQYFLARARLELGQRAEGSAGLAAVVRDFPGSYYMVLAYSRLRDIDAARADEAVRQAMAAEPAGSFVIPDHPALHQPGFLRAVELVRQGEGALALGELKSLGVYDRTAEPALLWAAAFLLARIEAPAESHGVLRASTGTWAAHYPAGIWRSVWEVAYPRPFRRHVSSQATRFGVPEALVYAVIREESAFKPRAVSHASAYGLMQLILPTARTMGRRLGMKVTADSLKHPSVNIPLGCRYLSILKGRFAYNPLLAIPGYNAGPGAPARWVDARPTEHFDVFVERIPYRETRRYTKRVIGTMAAYALLYGEGMHTELLRVPLAVKPGG